MMVLNMDCVAGMRLMPDNSFDSIVCDPPYELANDGKQSASGVFLEFAFPKDAKIVAGGKGESGLSLLVSKILDLNRDRDLPCPTASMPVRSVALDNQPAFGQHQVKHGAERPIDVTGAGAVGHVEAQQPEHLGCFTLKLADASKGIQVLNQIGAGFISGGVGIGLAGFAASLPAFTHCGAPVIAGDDNVRFQNDALAYLVGALQGATGVPVLSFNLGRGAAEQLSANGARLFGLFLLLCGAELIRTKTPAGGLPAALDTRRVSVVDDLANRAFSFDLIVHPQIVTSKGFMGKEWDGSKIAYSVEMWAEALRVLKPGGHLLAFSGSRTYHRMTCAIEDAGFEVRDQIMWVYGSGFPKSLDVSKAIDGAAGAVRGVIGPKKFADGSTTRKTQNMGGVVFGDAESRDSNMDTAPATDAARQWDGWGTALKPAHEPICVARKPLAKGLTVAANVLAHGTGALNINGCRVGDGGGTSKAGMAPGAPTVTECGDGLNTSSFGAAVPGLGRWPANLIHDGSDEVLAAFPDAAGQLADASSSSSSPRAGQNTYGHMKRGRGDEASANSVNEGDVGFKMKPGARRLDVGSAARFFYCAKTSKTDRNDGLDAFTPDTTSDGRAVAADNAFQRGKTERANTHPTVKPNELMRYLCRLVTSPGGRILDPFAGSGSTGKAAKMEGFQFLGFELSPEYTDIANARIEAARRLP